jgi:hypothetical protein
MSEQIYCFQLTKKPMGNTSNFRDAIREAKNQALIDPKFSRQDISGNVWRFGL